MASTALSLAQAVYRASFTLSSVPPSAEVRQICAREGSRERIGLWIASECERIIQDGGADIAEARVLAAMAYKSLGARYRPKVIEHLLEVVRAAPGGLDEARVGWSWARILRVLAEALEGAGRYDEAEGWLRMGLADSQDDPFYWAALANNLRKQNRLVDAIEMLKQAQKAPHYLRPLFEGTESASPELRRLLAQRARDEHKEFRRVIKSMLAEYRQLLKDGYVFKPRKRPSEWEKP